MSCLLILVVKLVLVAALIVFLATSPWFDGRYDD